MKNNKVTHYLSKIEYLGNKLPHPVTIFLIFTVILFILSHILYTLDITVDFKDINPDNNKVESQTIHVISLLTSSGISHVFTNVVENFTSFVALGPVLVAMLGVGVAEKTGYLGAFIQKSVANAPKSLITPTIVLLGILSNIAASVGYVVLVPLGAMVFLSFNRHPIAGLAAAFSGVAGGYSANLFLGTNDPILSGMTTEAAQIINPNYIVNATDNWFFMFVSTFLIVIIGTFITDKIVEPSLGKYDSPKHTTFNEINNKAFKWANISLAIVLVIIGLMVVPSNGILRGDNGNFIDSPFIHSIIFSMMLIFLIPGIVYGIIDHKIKNDKDAVRLMSDSLTTMSEFIVLIFFAAQFVALFEYTNIGTVLSVNGAELLKSLHVNGLTALIILILMTTMINILMAADSAKWALMAPIFIPMFMQLGVTPEVTQVAYRIGDSATNIISPLMPFFPYIVSVAEKYNKHNGIGTVVSVMLPYSIVILVLWTILFIIWYLLGIPVGPGTNTTI
ncbi:AbgT family transporter [Staphylococcus nepalensis]